MLERAIDALRAAMQAAEAFMHDSSRRTLVVRRRIAAPAPEWTTAELERRSTAGALPGEIDALCHRWGAWARQRRYAPSPNLQSTLAHLIKVDQSRFADGGFDRRLDPEASRFHQAVNALPEDQHAVLFASYVVRVNIAGACRALELSRVRWYRLRNAGARAAFLRAIGGG